MCFCTSQHLACVALYEELLTSVTLILFFTDNMRGSNEESKQARDQQAEKQMLKGRVTGCTQIWRLEKETRRRRTSVSDWATVFWDFLNAGFHVLLFKYLLNNNLNHIIFFYLHRTRAFGSLISPLAYKSSDQSLTACKALAPHILSLNHVMLQWASEEAEILHKNTYKESQGRQPD